MVNIATKVRIGIASGVIATAAVLPAGPAQAEPAAPTTTGTLGSSAVGAPSLWWLNGGRSTAPTASPSASRSAAVNAAPAPAPPSYLYLGAANPNPAERTTVLSVNPLGLLPGFVQPFFGWFTALNLEACVAGLSAKVGPYGTVSVSVGRSC